MKDLSELSQTAKSSKTSLLTRQVSGLPLPSPNNQAHSLSSNIDSLSSTSPIKSLSDSTTNINQRNLNWNNNLDSSSRNSNAGSNLDLRSEIYDNLLVKSCHQSTKELSFTNNSFQILPPSYSPTISPSMSTTPPFTSYPSTSSTSSTFPTSFSSSIPLAPSINNYSSHDQQRSSFHQTPLSSSPVNVTFQAKHTRSRSAIDPIITNELLRSNTSNGIGTGSKHHSTTVSGSVVHNHNKQYSNAAFLSGIEDKVSRFYYRHGLFCSRHPFIVILFAFLIVGISSFPIFNFFTISGVTSEVYVSSKQTFAKNFFNSKFGFFDDSDQSHWFLKYFNLVVRNSNLKPKSDKSLLFNHYPFKYHTHQPRWFQPNISYAFIQQIFIRSAVIPWKSSKLNLIDALRGPFGIVFELTEAISNYQLQYGERNSDIVDLNDVCLQVFEPDLNRKYRHLIKHLPIFSCLMLSPANIWKSDPAQFQQDSEILSTLLRYQDMSSSSDSPLPSESLHNIFFGVHFGETGIRRTYGQNRQRTMTYAITLAFKKYIPDYVDGLRAFLLERYPLSAAYYDEDIENIFESTEDLYHLTNETLNIYYQNSFTVGYIIPLGLSYIFVCLYMYFSVRKMEHVTNKFMYSAGTLCTVLMSVYMSFGLCFRLNLNSALMVNRLLPYFVGAIAFENMFIMTKSVLTQYPHIDAKVKVAQALSREGISITKNLLAELTVLTIGSFMFSPFFQECCIFAAVCLISDFFVQSTFFVSFVSCDIQGINKNFKRKYTANIINDKMGSFPKNIFAASQKPIQKKTPKRLRIVHFLAKMRFVQRSLLLFLSACIGIAIYNTYLVLEQPILDEIGYNILKFKSSNITKNNDNSNGSKNFTASNHSLNNHSTINSGESANFVEDYKELRLNSSLFNRIKFTSSHPVTSLPNHHWSNLFSLYNISLIGRFISFLPPILLSIPISPERTKTLRNPADSNDEMLEKFIPRKFYNGEYVVVDNDLDEYAESGTHFFSQWSKSEINFSIALLIPSIIFLIYIFILLYRCVCTRNYAEWRAQLSHSLTVPTDFSGRFHRLLDRLTSLVSFRYRHEHINTGFELLKHSNNNKFLSFDIRTLYSNDNKDDNDNVQDIDLIATTTNGSLIACTSMIGDISVFDAFSFEHISTILRSQAKMPNNDDDLIALQSSSSSSSSSSIIDKNLNFKNFQITSNVVISKSSADLLKTIVNGISVEDLTKSETNHDNNTEIDPGPLNGLENRPIWCLEVYDNYVLAGCGQTGRLEVWDAFTGNLAFVHSDSSQKIISDEEQQRECSAITTMRASFWGIALARLDGRLEILEAELKKNIRYSFCEIDSNDERGNQRTGSSLMEKQYSIHYRLKHTIRAHQQPIRRLEIIDALEDEDFIKLFGSRGCVLTGSMDNVLKVFSLDCAKLIYALNGHCGAISMTFIDPFSTATALSGCQLGQLFVWDLNTGTCLFSMESHSQAEVLAISSSQLYYVSSGTDSRICVWDRYSGHLVHEIMQQHCHCSSMLFLESNILVTARNSELIVWDVNEAKQICVVLLSGANKSIDSNIDDTNCNGNVTKCVDHQQTNVLKLFQCSPIRTMLFVGQGKAFVCDSGDTLSILSNPFISKKLE